ncbi:MAG: hypothetical protein Q4G04_05965 [bacterium]|nr:hypothetical protein [bacterium]
MEKMKGKYLFLSVIYIAVFIVILFGTSVAWFTATAGTDDATNLITTGTLTISYADGSAVIASNLKPATAQQVGAAYANNTCAYGNDNATIQANETICTIYRFTVTNTGSLYANLTAAFSNFSIVDALTSVERNANGNTVVNGDTSGYFKYAYTSVAPGTAQTFTGSPLVSATGINLTNSTLAPNAAITGYIVVWLDSAAGNTYQGITAKAALNVTAVQTNS